MARKPIPWEKRFFDKVVEVDGCWMWIGAKMRGYGFFRGPAGPETAHRSMQRMRQVPTRGRMKNKCGNRACVRPDHWE